MKGCIHAFPTSPLPRFRFGASGFLFFAPLPEGQILIRYREEDRSVEGDHFGVVRIISQRFARGWVIGLVEGNRRQRGPLTPSIFAERNDPGPGILVEIFEGGHREFGISRHQIEGRHGQINVPCETKMVIAKK